MTTSYPFSTYDMIGNLIHINLNSTLGPQSLGIVWVKQNVKITGFCWCTLDCGYSYWKRNIFSLGLKAAFFSISLHFCSRACHNFVTCSEKEDLHIFILLNFGTNRMSFSADHKYLRILHIINGQLSKPGLKFTKTLWSIPSYDLKSVKWPVVWFLYFSLRWIWTAVLCKHCRLLRRLPEMDC